MMAIPIAIIGVCVFVSGEAKCILFYCPQEEEGQAGDQDQEEKRWNKRTQQMLHGLQVEELKSNHCPSVIYSQYRNITVL